MSLKTKSNDVRKINAHLKGFCKEKNIFLIVNKKKIKSHHLKTGKHHLNRKGSNFMTDMFVKGERNKFSEASITYLIK